MSVTEKLSTELSYSYELMCRDAHLCSLVEKSVGIRLLGKKIDKSDSDSDMNETMLLEFLIVFTPPKAFRYMTKTYY